MNAYTYDMIQALANERLSRYMKEAENHRLAKSVRPEGAGSIDRLVQAIGHGLVSIGEIFKVGRRPQLPAI